MKRPAVLIALALTMFLSGCVPVDSLNPLYTGKDIIFDPALLGVWIGTDKDEDGEGGLEFTQFNSNAYVITMIDKRGEDRPPEEIVFHAYLVSIEGHRFLDAVLQTAPVEPDSFALRINQSKRGPAVEPRLLRLGLATYMEFTSVPQKSHGLVQANVRRAHWFLKVATQGKKLHLDWMDDDRVKEAVSKKGAHVGSLRLHNGDRNDFVITAETRELQKFVVEHINDENVFSEHIDVQRRP
jgi:hypothetical protein